MTRLLRILGRTPLRAQLALLVAVAALPSLIGFFWYAQATRDDTRRVAQDRAQLIADLLAERLSGVLRAHERHMADVAREPRIQSLEPETCAPLLRDFARQHEDYQAVNLRALSGDLVCGLATDLMDGERTRRTPWYLQAVASEKFLVSAPLFSSRSGRWVAPMMMPVRVAGGRRVGMVTVSLDLLRLSDAVMADLAPEVAVVVSDGMGQVLLASSAALAWVSLPAADAEVGVRESAALAQGPDASLTERVTLHQPLGPHGWVITVDVPQSQAYLSARRAFGYGVAASLVLLLGALALTWRMAEGLLRPLTLVRQALDRVADGDIMARVREDVGAPELRGLAAALNQTFDTRVAARARREADHRLMSTSWDASRQACVAVDARMRVTHVNPAACAFTQWAADQAVGKDVGVVCALRDLETGQLVDLVAAVQRLTPDLGAWTMWQLGTRGGDSLSVLGRVVTWSALDGDLEGLLVLFVDVSSRSAAMRDLMDARGYTRQIIESLPLGLVVRDRGGRYVEFNPVMERITGQSAQNLLGASTQEARLTGAPVLRESSPETVERALLGETIARPDAPSDANGLRTWYSAVHAPLRDSGGEITGVLSLLQDITARKEAEVALRDSEEGLATVLRSIGDAVLATDTRGCVTRMNPAAERLTGWHLGEALGKPLAEVLRIVDAVTRRPAQDLVQRVLVSGKVVGMAENTALLSRSGKEYLISDSAAPMRDANGRIVGVVLVLSDVSEQHRLREGLQEKEARFRAVVEGLPVGVMLYEEGRVAYSNPMAMRILGASAPEQLLGRVATDFLAPEQREQNEDRLRALAQTPPGAESSEWIAVRMDGARIRLQVHMVRITSRGRPAAYVSIVDVTEARRTEQALRENEQRFRAFAESTSVGLLVVRGPDVLYLNPAGVRMLGGTSMADFKTLHDVVDPALHHRIGRVQATHRHEGSTEFEPRESRFRHRDGHMIDVEVRPTVIEIDGVTALQSVFIDIGPRKQAQERLRESEARFRTMADLAADWYWEQDEQFRFTRIEGRLHAFSGRSEAEFIGRTRWDLPGFELDPAVVREHRALLEAHQEFRDLRTRGTSASGETFWASTSGSPIFDAEGRFQGYRGIGRVVASETPEDEQLDERLAELHDAATGLPSRALFVEQMRQAMASSRRHGVRAALLLVELGATWQAACASAGEHGDAWSPLLARRLRGCVREVDAVARLRVGQFVLLLDGLAEKHDEALVQARAVGEKILRAMDEPLRVAEQSLHARACVGATLLTRGEATGEETLRRADLALRQWIELQPQPRGVLGLDLDAVLARRAALESGLRATRDGHRMQPMFEPRVTARGEMLGTRISMRWDDPALGTLRQEEFLRVADAAHLLLPLGRWLLERACAWLADTARGAPSVRGLEITLPVGACQLEDPGFAFEVEAVVRAKGVVAGRLRLELEAPDLLRDTDACATSVARLRTTGFAVAVAHRGPVHCPAVLLEYMRPTHITIHRGLVRDILGDTHVQGAMADITQLAQRLGARLVAEGVETEAQRAALAQWGCVEFLGPLFGVPSAGYAFDAERPMQAEGGG